MIDLEDLLNIVCTEAFEHDGIPEVPDNKHGAMQNYSAEKRGARSIVQGEVRAPSENRAALRYDLELVREEDGTLRWVE
jgi:hypothetical protein